MKFNFDNSYIGLSELFYTLLDPVKVKEPEIVIINHTLMSELGIDYDPSDNNLAEYFSGNLILDGSKPLAMAYAGHQFGHFTLLGDGRAHLLGEHITPNGQRFDIHLKGSGRTPYARRADGRAALKPMLREYIISEAMHALGIPTTRSLAVITTGEKVIREDLLTGAILTRVASSHIRIGTFEYAAYQQDETLVEKLLDYTINRHYPELINANNKAMALLEKLIDKQTDLITHWMRVGFIHGVMNTDNMTLSGETIDYGPCAFMDIYNPKTVFSSIDTMGRYAYSNQPLILQWNIARLAESLLPLIHKDMSKAIEYAEEIVNKISDVYQTKWLDMMLAKLGLSYKHHSDKEIVTELLSWMEHNYIDYTNCFYDLTHNNSFEDKKYQSEKFKNWYKNWQERLEQEISKPSTKDLMQANNPTIIPRNHNVEHALESADKGNLEPLTNLLSALKNPYSKTHDLKNYQSPPAPSERVFQTFCGT